MQWSNIFFVLPIIGSFLRGEWIYFSLATAICIASTFYHYFYEQRVGKSKHHTYRKNADWIIALLCFVYMFFFAITKTSSPYNIIGFVGLLSVLVLFTLGYKGYISYSKTHPYFHVLSSIVAFVIVFFS